MLSRLLREILLNLIHLIVNVVLVVRNVYHRFWFKRYSLSKNEVTSNDIKMILEHVPRMSKSVKHLVVLADTDCHSLSDLARVIIWSLLTGIPYVSFHDITGELKKNEGELFLEVERNKKGIPGCIKWSNKPDLNGYTNGNQSHTVIINIFTSNDGRPTIAQCIKKIAQGKITCERDCKQFTAQELDKALRSIYPSIPDPDLILYTGDLCSTHGFLPWQIRLTEFVQLSIDHSVSINSYIGALYKYNKCDQRFGK